MPRSPSCGCATLALSRLCHFEAERYDELTRVAAVAVNGVLVHYKRGAKTPVRDGDTVAFVKAAAGG